MLSLDKAWGGFRMADVQLIVAWYGGFCSSFFGTVADAFRIIIEKIGKRLTACELKQCPDFHFSSSF